MARPLPQLETITDLIWIQTSFLGDIILQTAAFVLIRKLYPSLRQHLITTPLGAKALADHPALESLVVFDKRGRPLYQAIQLVKKSLRPCDPATSVTLQAHRSTRSSLLAWALGLPSVTYEETSLSCLATARVPRVAVFHESQRLGLLLEPLGLRREAMQGALPELPGFSSQHVLDLLKPFGSTRLVAMAPGSVWATKRWPIDYYIHLGRTLLTLNDTALLILGSQDEKLDAAKLETGLGAEVGRCLNLAGKTSLDELRSLYPRLTLLISNDSSPLHYASAFGVPSLAIFGSTVPAMGFGPLARHSRIAGLELACRPCSDHGPKSCPLGHFNCMNQLEPAQVSQIALDMLANLA